MKCKYPAIIGLLTIVCVLSCTKAGDMYQYYTGHGLSADNRIDRSLYFIMNAFNNFEIQAGQNSLLYKGSDLRVRSFGGILVNDYKNCRTDLRAVAAETWPSVVLTDSLGVDYQQKLSYLSGFAGHDYDTAYLGVIVRDHAIALNNYNQGIIAGWFPQTRNYSAKWLPKIALYMKMADSLLQNIR